MTIFYSILAALFVLAMLSLAGSAVRFIAAYEKAPRWPHLPRARNTETGCGLPPAFLWLCLLGP